MACCTPLSFTLTTRPKSPPTYSAALCSTTPPGLLRLPQPCLAPSFSISTPSLLLTQNPIPRRSLRRAVANTPNFLVVESASKPEPLKVMISGAPASGKGTQCELIVKKYGLVHIAAGDLLRAEIAAASENGRRAKEYMEKGQLVPDEIVVTMVKERLMQSDSQENGWLLDGYPRSSSQATALKGFGFQPDLFILLEIMGAITEPTTFITTQLI